MRYLLFLQKQESTGWIIFPPFALLLLPRQHEAHPGVPSLRGAAENLELPPDELLSDAIVLESIPKTMQQRATNLLQDLKTRPDLVLWDERGQVTLDGEKIADSNISDLMSDAMRKRKGFDPTGSKRFFRVLSELNVPKYVARNSQR